MIRIAFPNQANLLIETRRALGMTQKQFGELIGLSPTTANKYISGMERGMIKLAPARWKRLTSVVPKDVVKEAALDDFLLKWESQWDRE